MFKIIGNILMAFFNAFAVVGAHKEDQRVQEIRDLKPKNSKR